MRNLFSNFRVNALALVYWFYMHLREEGSLVRITAVGVAIGLLFFAVLSGSDYATRNLGEWVQYQT